MNRRYVTAAELDSRLSRMDMLISQLATQNERHETWHRDMLVRAGEAGHNSRIAVWALVISAGAAIAALLTAAAAVTR